MSFLNKIKTSYVSAIKAHYEVTALDASAAKELAKKLEGIDGRKAQQTYLEKFVVDEGIAGDDLLDLMYDLGKEGFSALTKPTIQGKPKKQHANPMIARIEKGQFDDELGRMLCGEDEDGDDDESISDADKHKYLKEVEEYFKKNPDKFGKFICEAAKKGIGFYENDFHAVPITKAVLEHVTDDYLLQDILYQGVYGFKNLTEDAIEYAYGKFKNPIKKLMESGQATGDVYYLAADKFDSGPMKQKMKDWFHDLTPAQQKDVAAHWSDYTGKDDETITDYLNN